MPQSPLFLTVLYFAALRCLCSQYNTVSHSTAQIAAGSTAFVFTCAFFFSPQVRRGVHRTSAASRRDAERAKHKVQVPNLALKAFLSLESLAVKAYLKVRLEIQA